MIRDFDQRVSNNNEEDFEDGYYGGYIVGIVDMKESYQEEEPQSKSAFLVQLQDNKGNCFVKKTKSFKFSLSSKGNFARMFSNILRCTNEPSVLRDALKTAGILTDAGLDTSKILGHFVGAQIVCVSSKKDSNSFFAKIETLGRANSQLKKFNMQPCTIPAYLKKPFNGSFVASELVDGFSWGDDNNNNNNNKETAKPEENNFIDDVAEDIPF